MNKSTPSEKITQIDVWSRKLEMIAEQPLEFCPEFPEIAARHESFWTGKLDFPLFLGATNTNPARPITRRLDFLDQPEAWLSEKLRDMQQTYRVGDALPFIRADFGPVMLGGLLGAQVEFQSDTTWTHEFIDNTWSNEPSWEIAEDNTFWQQLQSLLQVLVQDAPGRYLMCNPDLGGSGDVLLNLRGSAQLAMDVVDQPERITQAVDAIYYAWRRAYTLLYDVPLNSGVGVINWHQLWSNRPYMIPACDFNALVGPRAFQKLLLPDIDRQARSVGRAIFHLDGPDAARHIDSLLELDSLDGIQYTPGAGTPSALAKLDMFRKVQASGKSLLVMSPADEVAELCQSLEPQSLAVMVEGKASIADLDRVYGELRAYYDC